MKKLLFILIVSLATMFAAQETKAQGVQKLPTVSADTLVNADTVTKVIRITGNFQAIAIQPIITRLSGTAAGSVVLEGSVDGVNYVSLGDTLSVTNQVTNTAVWSKGYAIYPYYRIRAISSGTVSQVLNVWYVVRL